MSCAAASGRRTRASCPGCPTAGRLLESKTPGSSSLSSSPKLSVKRMCTCVEACGRVWKPLPNCEQRPGLGGCPVALSEGPGRGRLPLPSSLSFPPPRGCPGEGEVSGPRVLSLKRLGMTSPPQATESLFLCELQGPGQGGPGTFSVSAPFPATTEPDHTDKGHVATPLPQHRYLEAATTVIMS